MIRLPAEYIAEIAAGRSGVRGPRVASSAVTLGSFDGLHLGHQALVRNTVAARRNLDLEAGVIFTFLTHPRLLLDGGSEPFLLTTWREKLAVLEDMGCPVIVAADFCPELARLTYDEFVGRFLVDFLGMKHFVVGYNAHLGAARGGTAATLGELGRRLDFSLEVVQPFHAGSRVVSSSAIRLALGEGDTRAAAAMLGRPYALWGEVVPGEGRGREIGYRTANVEPLDSMKLLPAPGVYAVRVQVPLDAVKGGGGGRLGRVEESLPEVDRTGQLLGIAPAAWDVYGGMLNYGSVPTFHEGGLPRQRVEVHVFDYDGDLRGRNIKVDWLERLRGERRFDGAADLVAQLHEDEETARRIVRADPITDAPGTGRPA